MNWLTKPVTQPLWKFVVSTLLMSCYGATLFHTTPTVAGVITILTFLWLEPRRPKTTHTPNN